MTVGLRFRLVLFTSSIVFLIGGAIALFFTLHERRQVSTAFEREARGAADLIAQSLGNDLYFLDARALRLRLLSARINPTIISAYVMDADGIFLADGSPEGALREQKPTDDFSRRLRDAEAWITESDGAVLTVGGPVRLPDGRRVGFLHVGFSLDAALHLVEESTRWTLLLTLLFLALGAVLALLVSSTVTRPIFTLVRAAQQIGQGKLDTRVSLTRTDELGTLAESFNQMAASLSAITVSKSYVESTIKEITQELDLQALLHLIIRRATELLGAPMGTVHLWDEANQVLIPQAWHGIGDWLGEVRVRPGEGAAGIVAAERRGLIINEYRGWPKADPRFLTRTGIAAILAEPLLYRDRFVGVTTVSREDPGCPFTERDRETLALFAAQAAIAIENARLFAAAQHELAERQHAEENLTREHSLLRTLIDNIPDRIYIKDTAGRYLIDNVAHQHCLGAAGLEAAVGKTIFDFCPRELADQFDADDRQVMATGQARVNWEEVSPDRETGSARWDLTTKVPLRDGAGRITGVVSIARDITERKRAEAALTARTRQLEAVRAVTEEITRELHLPSLLRLLLQRCMELVRASSGSVSLWDEAAGVFVPQVWDGIGQWMGDTCLARGEGISGVVAERRAGMIVNDFRASPYAHPLFLQRTQVRAVLAEPLLYRKRLVGDLVLGRDEPDRPFTEQDQTSLRLFAAQAATAIEHARLFAELNDSYRALQQAQEELLRSEKLRALGQMAAGIAHDLNNMLAAIIGQAELLRLRVAEPETQAGLATLLTAATDGAAVVRRLQGFARQQPAGPLLPCDLGRLVHEAVELTRPRWQDEPQRRGVVVTVRMGLDGLPPVLGQPAEIREALTNLILNAVDAMPDGGTLTLSARAVRAEGGQLVDSSTGQLGRTGREGHTDDLTNRQIDHSTPPPSGGGWVELTVTDTGVGMPPEIQGKIFEPFFTTKGGQGTGLGLSVVYAIMERHGGHITVNSTHGEGTTFTLRFQAAPAGALTAPEPLLRTGAPRRLLLIDDDPLVRKTLGSLLRAAGHTVEEADGGAAGVRRLGESPVDLVLTDLGMPEMSGWDVARAVKAARPALPVILLTGWGDQPVVEAAERDLVDRIVGKPFRLEELLAAIAECTRSIPADGT